MTPGPRLRWRRSERRTTLSQESLAAYSARIRPVSSVEPSSTTTQSVGRTVCAATLSSVRRMNFASSLQGEMTRYRRELAANGDLAMQIVEPLLGGEDVRANGPERLHPRPFPIAEEFRSACQVQRR